MSEEKYTEEDEKFIREQIRILNGEMDKIYDNLFKVIARLDAEDATEILKKLSEGQKKRENINTA